MKAVDLIAAKRDGRELTGDEIRWLVNGFTTGEIPDYQMAAWLMAVWIRGMNRSELAALTEVMLYSGEVLNHSEIPARKWTSTPPGGLATRLLSSLLPLWPRAA